MSLDDKSKASRHSIQSQNDLSDNSSLSDVNNNNQYIYEKD